MSRQLRATMAISAPAERPVPAARKDAAGRRWLLFVHQLPSTPSNLRVGTWRRLQQIGALAAKQAVYVLPDSAGAREDFAWLAAEVTAAGGDASLFAATHVDLAADDALVEAFRRSRQAAYAALAADVEEALGRAPQAGRPRPAPGPAARLLTTLRERLVGIERLDFFGSAGRDRVITLLERLEQRAEEGRPMQKPSPGVAAGSATYRRRLWITRPRPGVDRMSSAWLIRRFIDPDARFAFAADRRAVPDQGVPFDMVGVELTHQGGGCTFETLCAVFDLHQPALGRIAAIVHDLDLKDGRFGAAECATVGAVIEGLQLAHPDDDALLAQGMTLFDSLYRSFEQAMRAAGPAAVARAVKPRARIAPARARPARARPRR